VFDEVLSLSEKGWHVTGDAGGKAVTAQLDSCGQIMLLRVR
jgi:hypothetical protein